MRQAGFAKLTLSEVSNEAIVYREGDAVTTVRKLNGLTKYDYITLKWGVSLSAEPPRLAPVGGPGRHPQPPLSATL